MRSPCCVRRCAACTRHVFSARLQAALSGLLAKLGALGGTLVLAGSVSPTPPIELHPEEVVRRCLRIVGVHNYTPADLVTAVRFMGEYHQRFPFAELVSKVFPLNEAAEAFAFAERERPIRVGVRPG